MWVIDSKEQAFLSQSELDTGTITTYELNVRNDGKVDYCPRIEFTSKAGEPVAFRDTSVCGSAPDQSQIGKQVQVYYDPQHPDQLETKTFFTGYDALILGTIGFVFFAFIGVLTFALNYFTGRAVQRKQAASALRAAEAGHAGVGSMLLQDEARYHANQRAAENADRANPRDAEPPPDADEGRLAQLKQQEAELQRKIDERRQPGH